MPGMLYIFTAGLMIGSGITIGWVLINLITSYSLTLVNALLYRHQKRKVEQKANTPIVKLCKKCQRNPRPEGGLYCPSCQFGSE